MMLFETMMLDELQITSCRESANPHEMMKFKFNLCCDSVINNNIHNIPSLLQVTVVNRKKRGTTTSQNRNGNTGNNEKKYQI